ncbi:MAG TPA: glucoamylase family protein [Polyangiaceae bacterium]|nr:glucoamylase family protein [Polyangiaceae bacterium]
MHGRSDLEAYARSTWRSFERLVEPGSGLPADSIGAELGAATRAAYTSPTDIAMYLWAALAARDLCLMSNAEAVRRLGAALESLSVLERHEASGQFYNWYDVATLDKLTRWPEPPHGAVYPFASSVDNGWLASALVMIRNAVPALAERASGLVSSMNFRCFYDAHAKGAGPGLLRGGFWPRGAEPPSSAALPRDDYAATGESVVYTAHHYGAFNAETRIASYLGIALGQLPPEHYFAPFRTLPEREGWAQKARPSGHWRHYHGVDVFEGAYEYRGRRLLPTWGGSMFEALMPALVVPERRWGTRSWALTHPLYVQAQIEFGLEEARYGYWGFSPALDPAGGYREYGVPALGMDPLGYPADAERRTLFSTSPDASGGGPRDYGAGIVTPHAAFLALDFAPDAALDNLAALRRAFPTLYGAGGFKDSVNVVTGSVAERYLALDQGMVLAAIANRLLADRLQGYLARTLRPVLEPLMACEEFNVGAVLEVVPRAS